MVDTQVRAYKSLPEVRRVLRKLTDMAVADAKRLAGFRRALNVSCLVSMDEPIAALAAKPIIRKAAHKVGKSPLPDLVDEDEDDNAPKSKIARNVRALSPTKVPVKKVIKKSAAKPAREAPVVDDDDDNSDDNYNGNDDGAVRVRGRGGKASAPVKPQAKLSPQVLKIANGLSDLLRKRQNALQTAQHVRQALIHGFPVTESNTAKRALTNSEELVTETYKQYHETRKMMHKLGDQYFPQAFRESVGEIEADLQKRFKGKYESFDVNYAIATGTFNNKQAEAGSYPATFFIAYLSFENLKGQKSMADYVINLTQVSSVGADEGGNRLNRMEDAKQRGIKSAEMRVINQKRKEEQAKKEGTEVAPLRARKPKEVNGGPIKPIKTFVRVMDGYKSPTWVAANLGIEYADVGSCIRKILTVMQMDGMIGAVHPVAVPLSKNDLHFTQPQIGSAIIDNKNGNLRVILKPTVNSQEKAEKVWEDVANDIKKLITVIHPKFRNPINAQRPIEVPVSVNTKEGMVKQKRWVIDFIFRKSEEGGIETDMPANFYHDIAKHLGIPYSRIGDMVKWLKNDLGARS
jgi:hypothetical protein